VTLGRPESIQDRAATIAAPRRTSLGTVLAYGPPIVGVSAMLFFVQFFFLKFASDVLLLPPLAVGVIFALGRVWDAVSDPIVGTWSDRTRTRLGRRRPWMLAAVPVLAVSVYMIWVPPEWEQGALLAWVAVSLFASSSVTWILARYVPLSCGTKLKFSCVDWATIWPLGAMTRQRMW